MNRDALAAVCLQLMELQSARKHYIGLANKLTNAQQARIRRALGWRPDGGEASRKAINQRASHVMQAVRMRDSKQAKPPKEEDAPIIAALREEIVVTLQSLEPSAKARAAVEKEMARLARTLPAYAWVKGVRGFGDLGFAVTIGECGDLLLYSTPDKVWKRCGLAPYDGKAYSSWRREGGLTKEQWTDAGYKPGRRAEIHACVTESLLKLQKPGMAYRDIYDLRRANRAVNRPEWSKGHSHFDAMRVMTKMLLSDLWSEWRRAAIIVPEGAMHAVPSAEIHAAAEARA
jgi:hypothetical protein